MTSSMVDLDEMARLLVAAGIDGCHIPDLTRNLGNTVVQLMSIGEGRLGLEPPDAGVLHAFLAALRDGSALPEGVRIPDRSSPDADDQVQYAAYYSKFTTLCRLAKLQLPAALERLAASAQLPSAATNADVAKQEESELKDANTIAQRLRAEFKATYGFTLGTSRTEKQATPEQLVRTHQGLRRGTLLIGPLRSHKYGGAPVIERDEKNLAIQKGSLVQVEESTQIGRYSKVLTAIFAVLDSIVEGGMVDIDPSKQLSAGALLW